MFLLNKNKALMSNQNNLLIKRDYSFDGSVGKKFMLINNVREQHPKNLDFVIKDGKFYLIDINYTHSGVVSLDDRTLHNYYVGLDVSTGKKSYVVIEDIVYKEIKTKNDLIDLLNEIKEIYKDRDVTEFPFEVHEKIRQELKFREPSIEFLTSVAQNKKEFIASVENLINSNAINFVDQLSSIANDKKD